jgi:hypothetical protein
LLAAETATIELPLQIPAEQRGKTHTFLIAVDPQEDITEHDEENNTTEISEIAIPRELNVTGVTPSEGRRGDEIALTIYGENFTPETRVSIPLGIRILRTRLVDSHELEVRIVITEDALLGHRPISVYAPEMPGDVLEDSFTILDRAMPDLVVGTTIERISDDDQFLLFYVEIRNDGTGESAQTDVRAEILARDWASERVSIPALEPGDKVTVEIRMEIPDEQRGMAHTFEVKVDPDERVPESDEENNMTTTSPIAIEGIEERGDQEDGDGPNPIAVAALVAVGAAAAGGGAFAAYRFIKGRSRRNPRAGAGHL